MYNIISIKKTVLTYVILMVSKIGYTMSHIKVTFWWQNIGNGCG